MNPISLLQIHCSITRSRNGIQIHSTGISRRLTNHRTSGLLWDPMLMNMKHDTGSYALDLKSSSKRFQGRLTPYDQGAKTRLCIMTTSVTIESAKHSGDCTTEWLMNLVNCRRPSDHLGHKSSSSRRHVTKSHKPNLGLYTLSAQL